MPSKKPCLNAGLREGAKFANRTPHLKRALATTAWSDGERAFFSQLFLYQVSRACVHF